MGKFSKVPQNVFDEFQVDAGVLLSTFNPETPDLVDDNIICATTGGVNPTCTPTFSDWGEDVDNCPNDTKELKRIDRWEVKFGFTALNTTEEVIRMALGAADKTSGKITPRTELKDDDFKDLWWVGDRSDGGLVAICIKNALSTGGFSLQTTKNGKGQLSVELTGHTSIATQDEVPMEFYVKAGSDE